MQYNIECFKTKTSSELLLNIELNIFNIYQ